MAKDMAVSPCDELRAVYPLKKPEGQMKGPMKDPIFVWSHRYKNSKRQRRVAEKTKSAAIIRILFGREKTVLPLSEIKARSKRDQADCAAYPAKDEEKH
jgi:hypothetical protein